MTPPLYPFSITRCRLLMEMRAAVNAPQIGSTESLLGDGLRFAFLCSRSGPQLETLQMRPPSLEAESQEFCDAPLPLRLQMIANRWADEHVHNSADETACIDAFLAAMKVKYATEAIDASEGTEGTDAGE